MNKQYVEGVKNGKKKTYLKSVGNINHIALLFSDMVRNHVSTIQRMEANREQREVSWLSSEILRALLDKQIIQGR